jgi:hypothetical protein
MVSAAVSAVACADKRDLASAALSIASLFPSLLVWAP